MSVRTLTNAECSAGLPFAWLPSMITDNMICMDGFKSGSCNGDSGGPLVVRQAQGHHVIVGVTSWGSALECGLKKPSVYARVTSQLSWIRDNMSGTTCPAPS